MVAEPRLRLVVRRAKSFSCTGQHSRRAALIAEKVAARWLGALPPCELTVERAPHEHVGLGLGTQLTLAVGVALTRFGGKGDPPTPSQMSAELGRAMRSSIGTHGFLQGGLIVEAGHAPAEPCGPLVARAALPESWRVVLIIQRGSGDMSGEREAKAFNNLPPVPRKTTDRLTSEVLLEMLPAVRGGDFDAFAESVYRFGRTAGGCFAAVQGGPYAREAAPLVARLRELGVAGVGQSSWGPSVFALAMNDETARRLCEQLACEPLAADAETIVSQPDNRGVLIG